VETSSDRLSGILIRPPVARLRRYVETERADHALRRNKRRGNLATLDAAIKAFERAAAVSAPGHNGYERCLGNLSSYRRKRFAISGDPADVDSAIRYARLALEASSPSGEYRPWLLELLAVALHRRHDHGGDQADLVAAVRFARESARSTPLWKRDDVARRWSLFGDYAFDKYREGGQIGDLDQVVDGTRRALFTTRRNHPRRARRLGELAYSQVARYELERRPRDLESAIETVSEALAIPPPTAADRAFCLNILALCREAQFERSDDHADLRAAVDTAREAVAAEPDHGTARAEYLARLSALLVRDYELAGVPARLDEALASVTEALALSDPDDTDYLAILTYRALILYRVYEQTGDQDRLSAAIADVGRAMTGLRPGHAARTQAEMIAGAVKIKWYEITADEPALSEALTAIRAILDVTGPGHRLRALTLSNLGLALGRRYERTADIADLDDAIDAFREAEATAAAVSARAIWRCNLCAFLRARFDRNGDLADIDLAIDIGQQAMDELDANSPHRGMFQSNLGASLLTRFMFTGREEDLDTAIEAERAAVSAVGQGDPARPVYLMNAGLALNRRFTRTRELADGEEAVRCIREAIEMLAPGHASRPLFLSNLSACLDDLAYETGDRALIADAIQAARDALAEDHPERGRFLASLGDALLTRYLVDDDREALTAAFDALREALSVQSVSPALRLDVAQRLGRQASRAGDLDLAVNAFTTAIEILPSVVWHGLTLAVRQQHASRWAGLAAEAASCAVRHGKPELAVELLEQGRSLFWGQALNLRADLTDLAFEAPELAERLEAARAVMNASSPDRLADANPASLELTRQQHGERIARAARDYEQALHKVRAIPGFEHYLETIPYPELAAVGANAPIVIVNTSQFGSQAVIVRSEADLPQVVDLPGLDFDSAAENARQLAQIVEGSQAQNRPFLSREHDRHALLDILGWLWDVITEPVLSTLADGRLTATPGNGDADLPRIWWCPTGPLTSLPLHAAGHHSRHRHSGHNQTRAGLTMFDRAVSSYIPTLSALRRAQRFSPPSPIRHLSVAIRNIERAAIPPLPNVTSELEILARYFPAANGNHQLTGELATHDNVLAQIGSHDWVHFACHAGSLSIQELGNTQLTQGFTLWDRDLTVVDLAEQPERPGGLAFLSACQTASAHSEHRDEALHLAGAMQFLGYSHVIATMWSIADSPAPRIAEHFYQTLAEQGSGHAARALHQAVIELLNDDPTNPLLWAPYIHIGR
jgi:CHAT domain-containing protein